MLSKAIDEYVAQGKLVRSSIPQRLRDKLEHVLAINGQTLNRSDFEKYRDLRNDTTHDHTVFGISDVHEAYTFCLATIGAFYPCKVGVTHEDVTSQ
jgi:hypothetical protein